MKGSDRGNQKQTGISDLPGSMLFDPGDCDPDLRRDEQLRKRGIGLRRLLRRVCGRFNQIPSGRFEMV